MHGGALARSWKSRRPGSSSLLARGLPARVSVPIWNGRRFAARGPLPEHYPPLPASDNPHRRQASMSIILVLLHAYIGARLLPDLPLGAAGFAVGAAALAASAWLIPLGFNARRGAGGGSQR